MNENTRQEALSSVRVVAGWNAWTGVWFQAVARAWADPTFKQQLVANAREALKVTFDYELPQGIHLVVHESSNGWEMTRPRALLNPELFDAATRTDERTELHVPLLPPPGNLEDGLVQLTNHLVNPTVACMCACF
jgi:ribosomally synthesized peptide (two-chain TOMM family)